ncbi:hypothetical protein [Paenibacillus sp. NPDC093718]|uniref:hypothetical protein n=1 Tax=Paenibacillus sp. NPDC093718 TaxID=3390601 RepID=UPI003D066E19
MEFNYGLQFFMGTATWMNIPPASDACWIQTADDFAVLNGVNPVSGALRGRGRTTGSRIQFRVKINCGIVTHMDLEECSWHGKLILLLENGLNTIKAI